MRKPRFLKRSGRWLCGLRDRWESAFLWKLRENDWTRSGEEDTQRLVLWLENKLVHGTAGDGAALPENDGFVGKRLRDGEVGGDQQKGRTFLFTEIREQIAHDRLGEGI